MEEFCLITHKNLLTYPTKQKKLLIGEWCKNNIFETENFEVVEYNDNIQIYF